MMCWPFYLHHSLDTLKKRVFLILIDVVAIVVASENHQNHVTSFDEYLVWKSSFYLKYSRFTIGVLSFFGGSSFCRIHTFFSPKSLAWIWSIVVWIFIETFSMRRNRMKFMVDDFDKSLTTIVMFCSDILFCFVLDSSTESEFILRRRWIMRPPIIWCPLHTFRCLLFEI